MRLAPFDTRELRRVLGTFVTGVTVVTTRDETGRHFGLTANSFSSVSLDPPLVLWSQAKSSPSHGAFHAAAHFGVNVLAEEQLDLSNRFATTMADKFEGLALDEGVGGVPLLKGCSAWFECRTVERVSGGDHTIYIGEVCALRQSTRRPLVFGGGQYLVTDSHDLSSIGAGAHVSGQEQVRAMTMATRAIARLCSEFDQTLSVSVWGNHGPTVVAWARSSKPVSNDLPLGLVLPVTSTATGRALAAHLPLETSQRLASAELRPGHDAGVDEPAVLAGWAKELASVRACGLARRMPGQFHASRRLMNAMSVAVLGAQGEAVAAITAVGDADGFQTESDSALAIALRETAGNLSARLGATSMARNAA